MLFEIFEFFENNNIPKTLNIMGKVKYEGCCFVLSKIKKLKNQKQ